jgi:preprotein translocase subunit SecF
MNIIGKRYTFLTISGLLVALSIILVLTWGFKEGIDFRGGTLWHLNIAGDASRENIQKFFLDDLKQDVAVTRGEKNDYLVRFGNITEADHQNYAVKLKEKFGGFEELSFQSIGPSIGDELRRNALEALALVILGISAYIAFAFRKVSEPVSSWKYGVITLITLLHDIAIPAGMFAILSRYLGIEIDTNFIVALLVTMGFSVHDTIVVFDRIRENLILSKNRQDLNPIVNRSINETFARSVNTSLTLVVVLAALLILGPPTLKYFILTILVGVLAGTYSSIFVASPLLTIWHDFSRKK